MPLKTVPIVWFIHAVTPRKSRSTNNTSMFVGCGNIGQSIRNVTVQGWKAINSLHEDDDACVFAGTPE